LQLSFKDSQDSKFHVSSYLVMDSIKIRCPKCSWEPDGKPYWQCGCGNQFDAFITAGTCPECKKDWEFTQCVDFAGGCNHVSPHLDWYGNLDRMMEEVREVLREKVEVER
jgi:hypothetical protein